MPAAQVDHGPRRTGLLPKQLAQQTVDGLLVTPALDEDAEHHAVPARSPPRPVPLARNRQHDAIPLPLVSRRGQPSSGYWRPSIHSAAQPWLTMMLRVATISSTRSPPIAQSEREIAQSEREADGRTRPAIRRSAASRQELDWAEVNAIRRGRGRQGLQTLQRWGQLRWRWRQRRRKFDEGGAAIMRWKTMLLAALLLGCSGCARPGNTLADAGTARKGWACRSLARTEYDRSPRSADRDPLAAGREDAGLAASALVTWPILAGFCLASRA